MGLERASCMNLAFVTCFKTLPNNCVQAWKPEVSSYTALDGILARMRS